jgi:hypothetical protein
MELTREAITSLANYALGDSVRQLAKQLLDEMDKPGVWDNAPEWATKAIVNWSAPTHYSGVYKEYTRELPKSRERQIAEEYFELEAAIGFCELALLKYKTELEAGK